MIRVLIPLICSVLFVGCSQQTDQTSVEQGHGSHSMGGGCCAMPGMSGGGGHGQHGTAAQTEKTGPGPKAVGADQAKAVYTCPMHPEVVSDKPGTCPKCGMKLVVKK